MFLGSNGNCFSVHVIVWMAKVESCVGLQMDFVVNSLALRNGRHIFSVPIYAHFSSAVIKASLHLLAVAVWNTVSVIPHDSVCAVAHSKILQLTVSMLNSLVQKLVDTFSRARFKDS